jgi:xylulokinase
VHRFGLSPDDVRANVRAVVEGQQMAMALHSRWIAADVKTIHATGGAAINREILQVMADVFGADVYQFEVSNSAALGAALRAIHAEMHSRDVAVSWSDVVRGLAEPLASSRLRPDPGRHAMYAQLMNVYATCEAFAQGKASH